MMKEELKQFLEENKEDIHSLLNHMWQTIEKMFLRISKAIPETELANSYGNYIKIREGWGEATYPNPSVHFPFGEFGYSLDNLFCVFSINPRKVNESFFTKIIPFSRENEEITMEIYGGENFLQVFFHSAEEVAIDEALKAIKESKEESLQFSLAIEVLAEEEKIEALITAAIELFIFLRENDFLLRLPGY